MHPLFTFIGSGWGRIELSSDKAAWILTAYSFLSFMTLYCVFLHFACSDWARSRPVSERRTRRRLVCMAHLHYTVLCLTTMVFTFTMTWTLTRDTEYDFALDSWLYSVSVAMAMVFTTFNFLTVGKGGFGKVGVHCVVSVLLFVVSLASYQWWSEADRVSMAWGLIGIMMVAIPLVSVLFCSMLHSVGVLRLWLEQDVCIRKMCFGGRISEEGQREMARDERREQREQVAVAGTMNAPLIIEQQEDNETVVVV